ncbi:GNAT family N-acetyltransferase [Croceivirga radicis]|uniref:GNAT family N-acetyltransferase n=1 Tax=Croceivirga radicis TaxID=1929488 RepID=UPI000255B384|nr:GNAT family N-acetyltransferase [Croceivirga radicis]
MTSLPKHYTDHCLFQLYLNKTLHAAHQGKVQNLLVNRYLSLTPSIYQENEKSFYIIKDVPDYLYFQEHIPLDHGFIKVPQYHGHLVNLYSYQNLSEYLNDQLSKRNIKNLKSKKRKLESLGKIEYKVLSDDLGELEYAKIFNHFKELLSNRFDQKGILNRDLSHWQQLYRFTLPKLCSGEAKMFIIYNNELPICIALNYIVDHVMFSHIQTYDTDYSKYNLGDIHMQFQLEWCFSNNIDIYDVSKGTNPYKEKWCNHRYRLFHEIVYSKKSVTGTLRSKLKKMELNILQRFRNIGILGSLIQMDKWLYKIYKWRK